jgi:hypothetical protein
LPQVHATLLILSSSLSFYLIDAEFSAFTFGVGLKKCKFRRNIVQYNAGFCFVRKCACKVLLLSWFYQASLPELLQSSQRPFAVQW